jgi:transcription initiation factor TFIIH subunit 4
MVSAGQSTTVDREILDILKHAGLMSQDSSSFITTLGFQFLLMDTPSQVWYFILQYFKSAQERGLDLIDCLTFTFQLSFSTLGKVVVNVINVITDTC